MKAKPGPKPKKSLSDNPDGASKRKSNVKKKKGQSDNTDNSGIKTKKEVSESDNEGQALIKSKADTKAKTTQINLTNSPKSAKLASKAKNLKSESGNSPAKAKPWQKAKNALLESNKSNKPSSSPSKPNTDSPKDHSKKLKKGAKRPANLTNTEGQNSTSDESDTLYSLNEPERKRFKFDQTDIGDFVRLGDSAKETQASQGESVSTQNAS